MSKDDIKLFLKEKLTILLIIILILGTLSSVVFNKAGDIKQDASKSQQDALMAARGELAPFDFDISKDIQVDIGNNNLTASIDAMSKGANPIGNVAVGMWQDISHWTNVTHEIWESNLIKLPLEMGIKDNSLVISGQVSNAAGELVCWFRNNTWKCDPSSVEIGDRNYNSYAFEVIDPDGIPLLNIRIIGSNEIQIGGLFTLGNGRYVLVSDNGGGIQTDPTPAQISQLLVPIFKYPSNETNLGQLVNPTYLEKMPLDKSDELFLLSSTLEIVGYVLLILGPVLTIFIEFVRWREKPK